MTRNRLSITKETRQAPTCDTRQTSPSAQAGFTLLEMVVVMVLTGIMAGITSPMLAQSLEGFINQRELVRINGEARLAMSRMSRELREASAFSATPINGGQVQFTRDDLQVTFAVDDAGKLVRNGSQVLAEQVANLTFVSNADGGAVTELAISLDLARDQGGVIHMETTIYPRNAS